MAKRRRNNIARSGMPLEWAFGEVVGITTVTPVVGEIDLDLLPNEIAEIWKIDAELHWDYPIPDDADNVEWAWGQLSMNPDLSVAVLPEAEEDDLETFFTMADVWGTGFATAVGFQGQQRGCYKNLDFNVRPILVGTNVGMKTMFDSDKANEIYFSVRLYFTRRTATAQELNQILLKRR